MEVKITEDYQTLTYHASEEGVSVNTGANSNMNGLGEVPINRDGGCRYE